MIQDEILSICGNFKNIRRILIDETHLMLALKDEMKASKEPSTQLEFKKLAVQDEPQIWFSRQSLPLTNQEIEQFQNKISQVIDKDLRASAEAYRMPSQSIYRPLWHVAPPQGLLNDPNGFIYHQGKYHLFYQWYPFACSHKDKFWYHLTSSDLVHWQDHGIALAPSASFDSHGVFSGHAVSVNEKLHLFYTGNTRIGPERTRQATQCIASSDDGFNFEKKGIVIAQPPSGITEHFRDPKIIQHGSQYLMFIGAQQNIDNSLVGRLAIYSSKDLYQWQFESIIGDEMGNYGYMWECPDAFTLTDEKTQKQQDFMVICPQFKNADGVTSTHKNQLLTADFKALDQKSLKPFCQLDHGFDFYAPQSLQSSDNRRIMIGWMGLPDDVDHPSNEHGWIHQCTMPREICYKDGLLYQKPVQEVFSLRTQTDENVVLAPNSSIDLKTKSFELNVTLSWGSRLRLFHDQNSYFEIYLDTKNQSIIFDRSHTEVKDQLTQKSIDASVFKDKSSIDFSFFADNSSLECFIDSGRFVFTSRVFTPEKARNITLIEGLAKSTQVFLLAQKS